ncbi:MAG: translational repressor RegA, partial [Opitutales bacterium]|nr:translational repressor RegA [Opitutales bacterium]
VQTAHILHKKGKYYIVHFKEMFLLDGKGANSKNPFNEDDRCRRNGIVDLLVKWKLVTAVHLRDWEDAHTNNIRVVPFKERDGYIFESKYTIGS